GNLNLSINITRVGGKFTITAESQDSVWNPKPKLIPTVQCLLATGQIKAVDETFTPNLPEWKTKIGILEVESYLKNLKFSNPANQSVKI
ncbi:hypothetical protein WDU94_002404, partial [Cyamophila willieti]